ncbi:MAG: RNA recognition motif domain-containing protein [Candidatus Sumerlaeota bacterium]
MALFVGNLKPVITAKALHDFFSCELPIKSAKIICDPESGESKGYGFITMRDSSEENDAIRLMNGRQLLGHKIVVRKARDGQDRRRAERRQRQIEVREDRRKGERRQKDRRSEAPVQAKTGRPPVIALPSGLLETALGR